MRIEKGITKGTYVAYHNGCTVRVTKNPSGGWKASQVYGGRVLASATGTAKQSREALIESAVKRGTFSYNLTKNI